MITYELAKQLKDARFPQIFKGGSKVIHDNQVYIHLGGGHNGDEGLYAREMFTCCLDEYNKMDSDLDINTAIKNIYDWDVTLIPTLSELIETCGDGFGVLLRTTREDWCAGNSADKYGELVDPRGFGSSPEEAVARLWLALNKK